MRKIVALIVLVSSVAIVSAKPMKPAPAAPKCPACHMTLGKTKSAANPIAVQLKKGGPIYYCCAGCKSKMPASMIVKPKK
jgi:hypothetical protein